MKERDGTPWPLIYSTTSDERRAMTPQALESLWLEYKLFWKNHESHSAPSVLQQEAQKDYDEDQEGTYR